jgi:hypothetical protein
MTESSNSGTRIGSAERDAALTALGDHMRAGRLDPPNTANVPSG